MKMLSRPAISAVAAATVAMDAGTAPSAPMAMPLIRLPLTSGAVPMISGLRTMM